MGYKLFLLSGFDLFNYMVDIVVVRCDEEVVMGFELFVDEFE